MQHLITITWLDSDGDMKPVSTLVCHGKSRPKQDELINILGNAHRQIGSDPEGMYITGHVHTEYVDYCTLYKDDELYGYVQVSTFSNDGVRPKSECTIRGKDMMGLN